jgi:hypothetical protein
VSLVILVIFSRYFTKSIAHIFKDKGPSYVNWYSIAVTFIKNATCILRSLFSVQYFRLITGTARFSCHFLTYQLDFLATETHLAEISFGRKPIWPTLIWPNRPNWPKNGRKFDKNGLNINLTLSQKNNT